MKDFTALSKFLEDVDSSPEEGAKNVTNSQFYDISPDTYVGHKEDFDKEIDIVNRLPANIEDSTRGFITESKQHAAAAKDDYGNLNAIEKRIKYYNSRIFEIPEANRESNEYWNRKISGEKLTASEEEYLQDLDFNINEMQSKTYGMDGEGEKFVVDTLSSVGDIVRSYYDNMWIMGSAVAGGAGLGFAATLAVPIPGARIAGVSSGLTKGYIAGSTVVGFIDGYYQTRASTYKELEYATDREGNPLNIDDDTKRNVALGVGILSGSISALSSKVLAQNNPLVKRFLSGKAAVKTLMKSPALLAKLKILGSMLKSAGAEGSEESLQEFAQIVGVNFGKMDGTEGSFLNALDESLNMETLKRVGHAGALGASVGTTFAGASGAVAYKGIKRQHTEAQVKAKKIEATLSRQNNVLEVSSILKQSKISDLLPGETNKFVKGVYDKLPVSDDLFFALSDLQEFANDPDKFESVRNTIDKSGQLNEMASELNIHLKLQEQNVVKVTKDHPEFSDYLRVDPDGQTPKQIRTEAQAHVGRLEAAAEKRSQIEESSGLDQKMTPEQELEIQNILSPETVEKDVQNKTDYLDFDRFEAVEGLISQKDADALNNIEIDARLETAKILESEVDEKFQKTEDRIVRDVTVKKINADIKKLEKEFSIIDKFKPVEKPSAADVEVTSKHAKPGFSPLAIDPSSLSLESRRNYLEQTEFKKKLGRRKALVKGGIHIDEAVAITGVENEAELLKMLAETPSKTRMKKLSEQRKIAIRNEVHQTILPARMSARDRAFTNNTKTSLKQMDYIRSKEWPTLKRGIIKIAGKVPKVEGLNRKAKDIISQLPLRDLTPERFKNGESNSRKKAMQNWTDGQFEESYKNLEASALNSELRKETLNARDMQTKFEKFWKKTVNTPSNQEALRNAGMLDVMNEFTEVYNMSTSNTGITELKSFNNFITSQVKEGKFTPGIPERLKDARMSARDMSVEQYKTIGETGQYILHQAKLKNKLLKVQQDRKEFITADKIAKGIEENTVNNPRYDIKKSTQKASDFVSVLDIPGKMAETGLTLVNTVKTSVNELDGFKLGGFFQETIGDPIKQSRDGKRHEMMSIENHDKKVASQYGMKKFKKMFNEFVHVPELEGRFDFGDGEGKGKIRKIDLLVMQAYRGDPEGRIGLENFVNEKGEKVPIDVIETILERELSIEDAALVQSMMVDKFKRFKDRSFELQKKDTGIEMDMVEGVPFTHRGKEMPGGYYPIKRKPVPDDMKAAQQLEKLKNKYGELSGGKDSHFFAKLKSAEMTKQARYKLRSESNRPLDLKFENMMGFTEEFVHDLHFRETGIDLLKIMKEGENVKNMKSILGVKKYTNFLNSVKNVISKTDESESKLFSEEYGKMNSFIDGVHMLHAVKDIGFNLTSAMIQPDALLNLNMRVGPKASLYLANAAKKLAANPMMFDEYVKVAGEVNPDILVEADGIGNEVLKQSYDWMPSRRTFFKNYDSKSAQVISSIKEVQKAAINASFSFVREGDKINRVLATMGLTEMFLNGDIEGYSNEVLSKMSDSEKAAKMTSVVREAIDLSLTANAPEDTTPLEREATFKTMVRYFVDRRSRLNTMIAQFQKTKSNISQGDYAKAAGNMTNMALTTGVSLAFMEGVRRGVGKSYDELKRAFKDEDAALEFASDSAFHFATAPVESFLDMTPIVDNINYSANLDLRSDYRSVSNPFYGVMSDIAMGAGVLIDTLKAARKMRTPNLSKVQKKEILTNAGYIVGAAPTNAIIKAVEFSNSREVKKTGQFFKDKYETLDNEINLFIEAFSDKPEAKNFLEDLKEYQKTTIPQNQRNVDKIIPEDAAEVLKTGQWHSYNDKTGAAGIYEFTEERWNEIAAEASSLALTENGRVSEDTSQQEKAMEWSIKENAKGLIAFEEDVTNSNLYGAHRFGLDDYVAISLSNNKEKLTNVVGDMKLFEGFSTVGQVKKYVNKQVVDK